VATALLEALRDSRPDSRPLRAKVFRDSPGAWFAAAQGFSRIQRSRTFLVEKDGAPSPGGLVVDRTAPPAEVAAAFRDFYVSTHSWDPPGPLTTEDFAQAHLAESVQTMVVRGPGGEAVAVGCLYEEDEGLTLSGGPTDPDHPLAGAAAGMLLDAVARPFLVEADDSVPALLAALSDHEATLVDEVHLVADG
jgi:hypothetical protein